MSLRNTAVAYNTEDKKKWLKLGEEKETEFVNLLKRYKPNISLQIHPLKNTDPTAPDLIMGNAKRPCDLKCQNTPFFSAKYMGLDPRYTVTFNEKDYKRYLDLYKNSDLRIFFWVNWTQKYHEFRRGKEFVEPYNAIYLIHFLELADYIESGDIKLHTYERRKSSSAKRHPLHGLVDKDGNSTASYVIDLRKFFPYLILSNRPEAN